MFMCLLLGCMCPPYYDAVEVRGFSATDIRTHSHTELVTDVKEFKLKSIFRKNKLIDCQIILINMFWQDFDNQCRPEYW